MFIGVQTNFHVSEFSTRFRLEPGGSGLQPYMVTASLSASLVEKVTEFCSSTVHRRVSDPFKPFIVMKGTLFAAKTKWQLCRACNKIITTSNPLHSSKQHLSNGDCPEDKKRRLELFSDELCMTAVHKFKQFLKFTVGLGFLYNRFALKCGCQKTRYATKHCACAKGNLPCTDMCRCMDTDELCANTVAHQESDTVEKTRKEKMMNVMMMKTVRTHILTSFINVTLFYGRPME